MATATRARRSGNARGETPTTRNAKAPLTPLAGPYGHPFHPILVTIPIGAWVSSLLFDIATRAQSTGSFTLVDASHWLIAVGIIGAVLAAVFGLLDLFTIPRGTTAFRTALAHMALNLIVVGLYVVNFVWRSANFSELTKVKAGQLALSAVALVFLVVSGWLGGHLAYRYGVRVATEDDQADGYTVDLRNR